MRSDADTTGCLRAVVAIFGRPSRPPAGGAGTRWSLPLWGGALVVSVVIAASWGQVSIPLETTGRLLWRAICELPIDSQERAQATIVYLIRLPRVLAAAVVGASLAVAGAVMQGLFRNPLADAGLIGVSSGGALGGALIIGSGLAVGASFVVPLATFAGAVGTAFVVYLFASRGGRTALTHLLLVGVAVNTLFGSLTTLILSLSRYEVSRQLLFWLMGGLDGRSWPHLQMMLPFALAGFLPVLFFTRDLNILTLGEETATTLGLRVETVKRCLLVLSALLAAAAVAISGTIGFVGLVIPHAMRLMVGPNHRVLLPAVALGGAIFLVWCDLLARTLVASEELRLGIITACVGAPVFLHLLFRQERVQRSDA